MEDTILICKITDKDREKHSNLHAMQLCMIDIWKEYTNLVKFWRIGKGAEFTIQLNIKRP